MAGLLRRTLHGKTTRKNRTKKKEDQIRKDHPRRKPAQCPWSLKVCPSLPGLMFHGQLVKFQTFFEDAFSGAGERSNPLPVSPRRIRVLTNTHSGSNARGRKVFSWSLSSGKHERCLAIKADKNHVWDSWIDEGQRQHEVIRTFYLMKIDFAYELFQHIR